jgi:hypothetical protein
VRIFASLQSKTLPKPTGDRQPTRVLRAPE